MQTVTLGSYLIFNVQGLCPQTRPSKVPYIEGLLADDDKLFCALTETWLHGDYLISELSVDGYTLFRSDRKRVKPKHGRFSGGVCVYIRDNVAASFETVVQFSNGVVELLCVYSKTLNQCIVVVYRQPDYKDHRSQFTHFSNALNELNKFVSAVQGCTPQMIICGDFNLPHINWSEGLPCLRPSVTEENKMAFALNEMCVNYGLTQCIDQPTHKAGNILDLLFVSDEDLCHSYTCSNVPNELSHHKLVEVNTSHNFGDNKLFVHTPQREGLFRFNFFDESVDWNTVCDEFDAYSWEDELKDMDVNSMVKKFVSLCEKVCERHIPLKPTSNSNPRKRIPRERRILMRRRKKLNAQLNKVDVSLSQKEKLKTLLVSTEKQIMQSHAQSRMYQENKAIHAIKKNSKFFFSYVNKMSKSKTKIGPLLNEDEMYTSDPKEMANILAKQFASVFSQPKQPLMSPTSLFSDSSFDDRGSVLCDILFTVEDILASINELSSSSASGPDGFAALLLKKCAHSLCDPLYQIYRKCMDSCVVPDSFKISNITPIFKSGNKGLGVNYRPVALTSQLSKVFEKIVRSKILSFLDETSWLNKNQHGFRKGRSCVSQLIAHFETVIDHLSKGFNVDVIYLDFCKAFDKLDFNVLLGKLKQCGMAGKLGGWLHSFLTGRQQFVTVNGFRSVLCAVLSGVPQGSVLGPLLFLIMINDVDENVRNAFLSSFADDTRIGMAIRSSDDAKLLQEDLEKVYSWARDNNMVLNSSKFELLHYENKKLPNVSSNYLSSTGDVIDPSDRVKDLGVIMSNDCSFTFHIDEVISKVNKMVSWALRNFKCRSKLFILTIWKSILLPHLDYCSQLWSPLKVADINRLELVQKCFLKKMNCYDNVSYWDMLKDLGLYSLQRHRERYRAIYLWSILECLVPNPKPNQIFGKFHPRHGRSCHVPLIRCNGHQKTLGSSFSVRSAQIFNSLPKELRDM